MKLSQLARRCRGETKLWGKPTTTPGIAPVRGPGAWGPTSSPEALKMAKELVPEACLVGAGHPRTQEKRAWPSTTHRWIHTSTPYSVLCSPFSVPWGLQVRGFHPLLQAQTLLANLAPRSQTPQLLDGVGNSEHSCRPTSAPYGVFAVPTRHRGT